MLIYLPTGSDTHPDATHPSLTATSLIAEAVHLAREYDHVVKLVVPRNGPNAPQARLFVDVLSDMLRQRKIAMGKRFRRRLSEVQRDRFTDPLLILVVQHVEPDRTDEFAMRIAPYMEHHLAEFKCLPRNWGRY